MKNRKFNVGENAKFRDYRFIKSTWTSAAAYKKIV